MKYKNLLKIGTLGALASGILLTSWENSSQEIYGLAQNPNHRSDNSPVSSWLQKIENRLFELVDEDGNYLESGVLISENLLLVPIGTKRVAKLIKKKAAFLQKPDKLHHSKLLSNHHVQYELVKELPDEALYILKIKNNSLTKETDTYEISAEEVKIGNKLLFLRKTNYERILVNEMIQQAGISKFKHPSRKNLVILPLESFVARSAVTNFNPGETYFAFDKKNRLAGVCKSHPSKLYDNLLCISGKQINQISEKMKKGEKLERPKIGISAKVDRTNSGIFLFGVETSGIAERVGLKMGDTILEVDGSAIRDINDFYTKVGFGFGTDTVEFGVLRNNNYIKIQFDFTNELPKP